MYKKFHLITFLLILFTTSQAQAPIDDRLITIVTSADVAAKRKALVEFVWGTKGFPLDILPILPVIRNDISPVPGLLDLERVDTLTIEMDRGVKSYAHHFIPRIKNRRLVVLHHGHTGSFDDSPEPDDISFGMRRAIEGLLGDGYSVLAVYMPRIFDFETTIRVQENGGKGEHDKMFTLPKYQPPTGSVMKYFLEPTAASLNYLSTHSASDGFPKYTDFSMVGFSGGGWATTVYSAIDLRIGLSISVAGSIPLYLRAGRAIGDMEQTLPGFYSIAGYQDLYILGSHGPGRKQVHILNRKDWSCFGEPHHSLERSGGLAYDESIREYESRVRGTLINLGNTELFSVEIDEASPGHNLTWDAIYDTILPELNEGRRYIGSATGKEAIAKGIDGRPAILINGVWNSTKLPQLVGTPAVLRGGVSIHDMFYRTARNQLVHVSRPRFNWSRPVLISDQVISDPAAVSRGPGSFDVVALKSDYKLYHFRSNGATVTSELVSEWVKGLGQPTMIASSPDQLDVFYRSWNRQLYHARKIGENPWTIVSVGGRMLDFPTAVKMDDGTLRAFIHGTDGGLWEATRPAGAESQWSGWRSISQPLNTPAISGSPSASIINGFVSVSARTPGGRMFVFSFVGKWSYADRGGDLVGSPTATPRGIYARDTAGGLIFLDGEDWKSFKGRLD